MSIFLLLGFVVVLILFLNRNIFLNRIRSDSFLVKKLSSATWFKSPWKSGLFLFVLNTVLFSVSLLLIIGVGYLQIPFIHLFVMAAAVLVSFYLWNIVYKCWEGTSKGRLMQGFIGSG